MSSCKIVRQLRNQQAQKFRMKKKHNKKGADEERSVNSGLEETMISAYHQIRDIKVSKKS
jgi:hypothetical protein